MQHHTHLEPVDEDVANLRQVLLLQQPFGDAACHQPTGQLPELVEDAGRLIIRCPGQDVVVELLLGVLGRGLGTTETDGIHTKPQDTAGKTTV